MTTIKFRELEFELRQSKKRKTIGITVERDGSLILAVPLDAPLEAIAQTVEKRRLWIYRHLIRKETLNQDKPTKEYVSGEGFYYLGRSYRLKIISDEINHYPLNLYQGRFYLSNSALPSAREHFIEWYRTHSLSYLNKKISLYDNRIGVQPKAIKVRELGARWGSCTDNKNLCFHWRVAMLPPEIIKYLLVHEMIHLLEPSHNQLFWQKLEQVIPDYLEKKQWLAYNGVRFNI